jgi:hypothetical protein
MGMGSDHDPIQRQIDDIKEVYNKKAGVTTTEDKSAPFLSVWHDPIGKHDFRPARLRKAAPRFFFALLWGNIGCYVNNLSQAWLQQNIDGYYESRWAPVSKYTNETVILQDVGFEAFTKLNSTAITGQVAFLHTTACVIRFVVFPGPYSMRWTMLTRFGLIWGSLWMMRGISIVATVLPNPDHICIPVIDHPHNIWLQAYATLPLHPFVGVSEPQVTCEDLLYSGHTVAMTVNMFFLLQYSYLSPWGRFDIVAEGPVKWGAGILFCLWGFWGIIASHFHYTIDVLVGLFFACAIWFGYHAMIRLVWLKKEPTGWGIWAFIRWVERDAEDLFLWRRRALENLKTNLMEDESGQAPLTEDGQPPDGDVDMWLLSCM